jgi:hypothetical protein
MRCSDLLKGLLIGAMAFSTASSQTRAYVKYGPGGETIGMFNLGKTGKTCGEWQTFEGTVSSLRVQLRARKTDYRFTIRSNAKSIAFAFVLEKDEIPFRDVESLVGKAHSVRVRACRSREKGDWAVEEIALSKPGIHISAKEKENETNINQSNHPVHPNDGLGSRRVGPGR